MTKRGLLIGRFQPFHKGHLATALRILEKYDELIIAIGSAQFSHTLDNPFTTSERIEMIRIGLRAAGVELARVLLIPVPDIGEHSLWVARLKSLLPRFDKAFTNNSFVKLLLEESGVEVEEPELVEREKLSATNVRNLMLSSGDWESLLQPEVADYINSIGGPARLRAIANSQR